LFAALVPRQLVHRSYPLSAAGASRGSAGHPDSVDSPFFSSAVV